jgi:hypothetical protein
MGKAGTTRTTGGATGEITTTVLQTAATNGFGVMAYMKGTNGSDACYNASDPYAWTTSTPNYMYNQQITYSSADPAHWTYTPVKFWPNDFSNSNVDGQNAIGSVNAGKVSFFAYAPYVAPGDYSTYSTTHRLASTENTAFDVKVSSTAADEGIVAITANSYNGQPQVKYVLNNASLANSVDLLWGTRKYDSASDNYNLAYGTETSPTSRNGYYYNTDLTKQKVGETIDFVFKHALAKIGGNFYESSTRKGAGLYVILDLDNGSLNGGTTNGTAINGGVKENATLVTVSDISIKDLNTANVSAFGTTSDLVKSGWFNIAEGTWSETTETGATYSSQVDKDDTEATEKFELSPIIKEGTITYDGGWKIGGTARTGVTTTAQSVYTEQSNAPGLLLIPAATAQSLVVSITYTVRTYDTNLATSASGGEGTWTKVTQTITNKVSIPANSLKPNKYYKLLIHLGLTSVKFSAIVADWDSSDAPGQGGDDNSNIDNNKDIWLPSNVVVTP